MEENYKMRATLKRQRKILRSIIKHDSCMYVKCPGCPLRLLFKECGLRTIIVNAKKLKDLNLLSDDDLDDLFLLAL